MMPTTFSIGLYLIAWALLVRNVRAGIAKTPTFIIPVMILALLVHSYHLFTNIVLENGYDFSLAKILSLFVWVVNLFIFTSSLKKPLHNLLLLTLPASALALLLALYSTPTSSTPSTLSAGVLAHVFLSIIAYSTLAMAMVQSLALAYQDFKIRHKRPVGLSRLMPPLQTMEALLFELLWTGQILLTLSIVSGALFVENLMAQHLAHKTVFSLLAWITYSALLVGRHKLGWRGNIAIRWTLTGSAFLFLAYFGSQFVLELILQKD